MNREVCKAETLRWVNEHRAELGWPALDELPQGTPAIDCVLDQAFGGYDNGVCAGTDTISVKLDGKFSTFEYTPAVRKFVRLFDDHKYPELLLTTKETREVSY